MDTNDTTLLVPTDDVGRDYLGGLGRSKVFRLIRAGELTKVNVGRRSFVTRASIQAYVARLAEAASA